MLFSSFESYIDLNALLNQIAQLFTPLMQARSIFWSAVSDPAQRRQIVVQLLRRKSVLWIWDNLEPVAGFPEGTESQWKDEEQTELRDFLKQLQLDSASRVKVLLTSRRDKKKWLGAIPHRVAMEQMNDVDAAKLALKLGDEKHLTRAEIADWQPLLRYCAGNPLTLRVLIGQAVRAGLRGGRQIEQFVEDIRSGEQRIEDVDEKEGRHRSLGASLDYGFRRSFGDDELPIIALLHLFQGTVSAAALENMGERGLPVLKNKTDEYLRSLLKRAKDVGLLRHVHASWFSIRSYPGCCGSSSTGTTTALQSWRVGRRP